MSGKRTWECETCRDERVIEFPSAGCVCVMSCPACLRLELDAMTADRDRLLGLIDECVDTFEEIVVTSKDKAHGGGTADV